MKIHEWFMATLREWSWTHTGLALLLGTLALFNMGSLLFNLNDSFPLVRSWVYNVAEFGFPGVLALRMADRAVADGVPPLLAYGTAGAGVILLGVFVIGPLLFPFIGGDPDWSTRQDIMLSFNLSLTFFVGTVAYAHWRRANDIMQRVQFTELNRARQEQLLQSARLLALQARVEPEFLFETLHRVRDGIEPDRAEADRLLTNLIALLRALQPKAGATASTVARELAVVEAYGRASDLPALQATSLQLHASALSRPARLAPLVLLPTIRALSARGCGWQVWATVVAERLRLSIQGAPDSPEAATALQQLDLASLRERVLAVHGADARVLLETTPVANLQFDLPLEHEPDTSTDR